MSEDSGNTELPDLTAKARGFVLSLLEGGTASDAYRKNYDCENMSDEAIWVEASRLKSDPKVSLWVKAAREAGADKAGYTAQRHLEELDQARQDAKTGENYGAAVRAIELKGKVSGHYVERVKQETPDPVGDALGTIMQIMGDILTEPQKTELSRRFGRENVVSLKESGVTDTDSNDINDLDDGAVHDSSDNPRARMR